MADLRVLGVRLDPNSIAYAVLSGTQLKPVLEADGRIEAPQTIRCDADALFWAALSAQDLMKSHHPTHVVLKTTEGLAKGKTAPRNRMEGAFVGGLADLKPVVEILVWATITARTKSTLVAKGKSRPTAKNYMNGDYRGVALKNYSQNVQEAILAAAAVLP
ncbi:MAG: hypothetical protein AB7K71_29635 [Polyangiaceae bacterium]